MIFDEINNFFALVDRLISGWRGRKVKDVKSVPRRFVELFESHGVSRSQIPRFFGHDIQLSDLVNDESLLAKLTEPVLNAACSLFAVRREWLDRSDEEPYARHQFYKAPENFASFIDKLKSANPQVELDGYLIVSIDGLRREDSVLILGESVGMIGDTIIYRYHFCDDWAYSYWKSRAYLTACVAIAWKNNVYIKGRYAEDRDLSILLSKQVLPGQIVNRIAMHGRRWYAEDLALSPEQYLKGLDAERNLFGTTSALRLWLQLENDGWMNTGVSETARSSFEEELARYGTAEQ